MIQQNAPALRAGTGRVLLSDTYSHPSRSSAVVNPVYAKGPEIGKPQPASRRSVAPKPINLYNCPGHIQAGNHMNENKLGGWLQVAANIGIVAGLVLVGVQLKQNADLVKTQMLYEESGRAIGIETLVVGERGAEAWAKSIRDPEHLDLEEQRIVEALLWSYTEGLRGTHLLKELGLLDDEEWKKRVVSDANFYLGNTYGRAWWDNYSQSDYPAEVRDAVNARLAETVNNGTIDYMNRVAERLYSPGAGIPLDTDRTVAVIGTGDMGDSLGPRLAELGFRIIYGSRDPGNEKVRALVERTGNGASAATPVEAAQQGDIVLTLVPWPPMETVAQNLGDLDGKIVETLKKVAVANG
jgi:hypothetical protein